MGAEEKEEKTGSGESGDYEVGNRDEHPIGSSKDPYLFQEARARIHARIAHIFCDIFYGFLNNNIFSFAK